MYNTSPLFRFLLRLSFLFGLGMLVACSSPERDTLPDSPPAESAILLEYLETHGNLINGPLLPSLIDPEQVLEGLYGLNQLIIDLRPPQWYEAGHIAYSVNVQPGRILDFFDNQIEAPDFERIVLVCNNAMLSGYVNAVLRMLGHGNVYTLRNGLSSWDPDIAAEFWLPAMQSHMEGKLDTRTYPKPEKRSLPVIQTGEKTAYRILRARAQEILQVSGSETIVQAQQLINSPDSFFIISYWPPAYYARGHLKGSIQYTPKNSLHSQADLLTLPVDQPVVLWCFTGHHSSFVTAFLRLLGYQAYNVPYGANAFIHETMKSTEGPTRWFTEESSRGFPLVRSGEAPAASPQIDPSENEVITVQGGC